MKWLKLNEPAVVQGHVTVSQCQLNIISYSIKKNYIVLYCPRKIFSPDQPIPTVPQHRLCPITYPTVSPYCSYPLPQSILNYRPTHIILINPFHFQCLLTDPFNSLNFSKTNPFHSAVSHNQSCSLTQSLLTNPTRSKNSPDNPALFHNPLTNPLFICIYLTNHAHFQTGTSLIQIVLTVLPAKFHRLHTLILYFTPFYLTLGEMKVISCSGCKSITGLTHANKH